MNRIDRFHEFIVRIRAGYRAAADELPALLRPRIEQVARKHPLLHSRRGRVPNPLRNARRGRQNLDRFKGAAVGAQFAAMQAGTRQEPEEWITGERITKGGRDRQGDFVPVSFQWVTKNASTTPGHAPASAERSCCRFDRHAGGCAEHRLRHSG
jgi:hypothetical protein